MAEARASTPRSHPRLALAWMAGALASFSLVAITGREAARGATTLEIMVYRSLISLVIIVLVAVLAGGGLAAMRSQRLPLHVARAGAHFVGQYTWLSALTLIPLAQLFALEFTAPLWVALLAPLFLAERLTATRLTAVLVGFGGTLLVVRPGAVSVGEGTIMALVSAVGFALSMICTKQLTGTEPPLRILFYMFLVQTVASLLLLFAGPRLPDAPTTGWIAAIAVFGLTAHYALVRAFALADAVVVAPMDFLRLPLIAFVGVLVYAEPLDPAVLLGGGVVVVANFINLFGERRRV
jgi:drug/metabolite transporter (DMT)-like permease